jgi:hypothetical protein
MKKVGLALLLGTTMLTATAALAPGQPAGHHIFRPGEIQWKDAPPSLPPGAQVALLEGDPTKEGPFAMRLKFPDGYRVMPHVHGKTERVTVISGTLNIGFGEKFDEKTTHEMPVGTFGYWEPGVAHFGWMRGETVLQLNSVGPWTLTYVNPADDPRNK